MPTTIDYNFISQLEGGSRTTGYVPAPTVSRSGVTIATGFDLGQRDESDLRLLGLPNTLIAKLKPYLGLKGVEAGALLRKQPLAITAAEASHIDKAVKADHMKSLSAAYTASPLNKAQIAFEALPSAAQTVVASVSFQYGVNLQFRTPVFWKAVTAQDWVAAIAALNAFGDHYPTRRRKEALLLETIVE